MGWSAFCAFFSRVSAFFYLDQGGKSPTFSHFFYFFLLLIEIPTFSYFSGFFVHFRQMQGIKFLFFPNFLNIFLFFPILN